MTDVCSEQTESIRAPELNWPAENASALHPWEEIKPLAGGHKFSVIVKGN